MKGVVVVNYTIGFGNNLFQYCFGRLLAEANSMAFVQRGIPALGIGSTDAHINQNLSTIIIDDQNYKQFLYGQLPKCNIYVNGYFEDYKFIKLNLDKIRSWFPKVEKTNKSDVVLHLRLQNRLIQESHNKNHISAEAFKRVLEKFDYEKFHIVTDAGKWEKYTQQDIEKIRHEVEVGPNPSSNSPWVDAAQSLEYMNHLVEGLADLNPIVHCNGSETIRGSGGLRDDFLQDFNLIRSFEQVIIFNSTFSWWAATLNGAKNVAIFNPWKIAKPKHQRRNLGKTNFPGWFSWGSAEDLYFKEYGIEQ